LCSTTGPAKIKKIRLSILMIFRNVPQYPGYQLLSGFGALNPKYHARPWGPGEVHCPVWRVTLFTIKNEK
jgi:hypothetical protein